MMEELKEKREIKIGRKYRHFKSPDMIYEVLMIAINTETNEEMVVYNSLYGEFKTWVRPLNMFLEKVDKNKYPNVKQEYRFEEI